MTARPPKKSETLEVRLPYQTKTAFMARCQAEGRTASDAVRGFIEDELTGASRLRRHRTRGWQAVAAAVAGLVLGAVAAPTLAQTATEHQSFHALDRNHDGVLSSVEYVAR